MATSITIDASGVDAELAQDICDAMLEVAAMLQADGITRQEVIVGLTLAVEDLNGMATMH